MVPLRARVDLGAMAMNEYTAFPKATALFRVISRTLVKEFILLCMMQSVYSTTPGDWVRKERGRIKEFVEHI